MVVRGEEGPWETADRPGGKNEVPEPARWPRKQRDGGKLVRLLRDHWLDSSWSPIELWGGGKKDRWESFKLDGDLGLGEWAHWGPENIEVEGSAFIHLSGIRWPCKRTQKTWPAVITELALGRSSLRLHSAPSFLQGSPIQKLDWKIHLHSLWA